MVDLKSRAGFPEIGVKIVLGFDEIVVGDAKIVIGLQHSDLLGKKRECAVVVSLFAKSCSASKILWSLLGNSGRCCGSCDSIEKTAGGFIVCLAL